VDRRAGHASDGSEALALLHPHCLLLITGVAWYLLRLLPTLAALRAQQRLAGRDAAAGRQDGGRTSLTCFCAACRLSHYRPATSVLCASLFRLPASTRLLPDLRRFSILRAARSTRRAGNLLLWAGSRCLRSHHSLPFIFLSSWVLSPTLWLYGPHHIHSHAQHTAHLARCRAARACLSGHGTLNHTRKTWPGHFIADQFHPTSTSMCVLHSLNFAHLPSLHIHIFLL